MPGFSFLLHETKEMFPNQYHQQFKSIWLTLFLPLTNCALAGAGDAVQLWWMADVEQRLEYAIGVRVENETRVSPHGNAFRRNETRALLTWEYSPRHHFGIGYEHSLSDTPRSLEHGHDGIVDWEVHLPVAGSHWTSRQRLQYGFEGERETGFFRHRLEWRWVQSRLPFRLVPFVFDEWFLDIREWEMRQNRIGIGLESRINDHARLQVFAFRWDQWSLNGDHQTVPVVGMRFGVSF